MKLNIAIAYGVLPQFRTIPAQPAVVDEKGRVVRAEVPEKVLPWREITRNFITNAVDKKYPEGLKDRSNSKTWARVSRALNKAIETDQDSIEISRDGLDFVKICAESFGTDPHVTVVKEDLIEEIERVVAAEDKLKN